MSCLVISILLSRYRQLRKCLGYIGDFLLWEFDGQFATTLKSQNQSNVARWTYGWKDRAPLYGLSRRTFSLWESGKNPTHFARKRKNDSRHLIECQIEMVRCF